MSSDNNKITDEQLAEQMRLVAVNESIDGLKKDVAALYEKTQAIAGRVDTFETYLKEARLQWADTKERLSDIAANAHLGAVRGAEALEGMRTLAMAVKEVIESLVAMKRVVTKQAGEDEDDETIPPQLVGRRGRKG